MQNELIIAVSFGIVFVVTLLLLAIRFPHPTPFQNFVFRTVLSLAAAGVAATVPGFISVDIAVPNFALSAGGAIAVFIVVYRVNPAKLAGEESEQRIPDYTYRTLEHSLEIHDTKGQKATWTKTTLATPQSSDIKTWDDHLFYGNGQLEFVSTNMGTLMPPRNEGGAWSVTTVFDRPLEVKKEITKVLVIECKGTFTEAKETFSWKPMEKFESMKYQICVPNGRPIVNAKLSYYVENKAVDISSLVKIVDQQTVIADIVAPVQGCQYLLEWNW